MRPKEAVTTATYTLPELAVILGIGRRTVYELVDRGELPVPVLHIGRQMRVRRADVDEYLAGNAAAQ